MEDFIKFVIEELPAKKKRGRPRKGGKMALPENDYGLGRTPRYIPPPPTLMDTFNLFAPPTPNPQREANRIRAAELRAERRRERLGGAEGEGWIGDQLKKIKKTAQKVARKVGSVLVGKKTAEKIERYGDAVLFLSNLPLPPSVKEYLRKHGDEPINRIVIVRNPVQKFLTGAMNAVSLGSFGKKFGRLPYDDLFHLQLWVTTASGVYGLEKNEVITFTHNPRPAQNAEQRVVPIKPNLTMGGMMVEAEKIQGNRFTRYDASSNNCQDFVMALLKGSGLGDEADYKFVKQDVDSLFKDDSFLRKMSRQLTNLGASVSTAITGVDDKPISSTKTSDTFEIPSPLDTDVLEAGGKGKKPSKKTEKGQPTIPALLAADEERARAAAEALSNPPIYQRVQELLALRQRGELDANFRIPRPSRVPAPAPAPAPAMRDTETSNTVLDADYTGGVSGVKRGRGRPRKKPLF